MPTSLRAVEKVKKIKVDLEEVLDDIAKASYEEWKNLGSSDTEK